ncbi:unnamed protein product [Tuber aestivum]|uniref:Uncharacterized protein n=1 Tax=Tuber aestivum TaxID=59557 RepID=A0A292PS38_9PEZI|nr:unnamed protein product [Tuber aestivum]
MKKIKTPAIYTYLVGIMHGNSNNGTTCYVAGVATAGIVSCFFFPFAVFFAPFPELGILGFRVALHIAHVSIIVPVPSRCLSCRCIPASFPHPLLMARIVCNDTALPPLLARRITGTSHPYRIVSKFPGARGGEG